MSENFPEGLNPDRNAGKATETIYTIITCIHTRRHAGVCDNFKSSSPTPQTDWSATKMLKPAAFHERAQRAGVFKRFPLPLSQLRCIGGGSVKQVGAGDVGSASQVSLFLL